MRKSRKKRRIDQEACLLTDKVGDRYGTQEGPLAKLPKHTFYIRRIDDDSSGLNDRRRLLLVTYFIVVVFVILRFCINVIVVIVVASNFPRNKRRLSIFNWYKNNIEF